MQHTVGETSTVGGKRGGLGQKQKTDGCWLVMIFYLSFSLSLFLSFILLLFSCRIGRACLENGERGVKGGGGPQLQTSNTHVSIGGAVDYCKAIRLLYLWLPLHIDYWGLKWARRQKGRRWDGGRRGTFVNGTRWKAEITGTLWIPCIQSGFN